MKNLNKNITKIKQNNNFIVYIHIRPDINKPFYVGKGVPKREIRLCGRNQYWHTIETKIKFTDQTIYKFYNIETQEIFQEIRYGFHNRYN